MSYSSAYTRLTPARLIVTLSLLAVGLVLVSFLSISIGSEHVALPAIARILWSRVGGNLSVSPEQVSIILGARMPRILTAIVVGAGLSIAGAAYQGLLRNPLADPYILGVSTGAAVGAIVATIYAGALPFSRPLLAFAGALATIGVVYALGRGGQGGAESDRLILAGIITNTFLSSVVIFLLTAASGSHLRSIFSWLIGDLDGADPLLPEVAVLVVAGSIVIYMCSRSLNLLMTGEHDAMALGVNAPRVKMALFVTASVITGAVVAISGVIGFVGLVVPHAVRMAWSTDNRLVVPASGLLGAAFLLLGDTLARTIVAPREIHIGVITAIIGAPAFVYLLRRSG